MCFIHKYVSKACLLCFIILKGINKYLTKKEARREKSGIGRKDSICEMFTFSVLN